MIELNTRILPNPTYAYQIYCRNTGAVYDFQKLSNASHFIRECAVDVGSMIELELEVSCVEIMYIFINLLKKES